MNDLKIQPNSGVTYKFNEKIAPPELVKTFKEADFHMTELSQKNGVNISYKYLIFGNFRDTIAFVFINAKVSEQIKPTDTFIQRTLKKIFSSFKNYKVETWGGDAFKRAREFSAGFDQLDITNLTFKTIERHKNRLKFWNKVLKLNI
jgi:glucose-6-phosphate 1-dehydrogenase